jgi:hypothetical protein
VEKQILVQLELSKGNLAFFRETHARPSWRECVID